MKSAIKAVSERKNLSVEEAARAMSIMLSGEATQAQIGAYLTALRMKGETIDEIIGSASVLKEKAEHIHPNLSMYIDLVGTGGDYAYTFNISTTSAFVAAAAGLPVAKHGNRAISSKSGAGDVLEALGVNIIPGIEVVEKCVEEVGIGFMFAPAFNKAMKYVGQARSEMGIRSIFNILGPMANPSGAKCMLIGVYDQTLCEPIATALMHLGVENGMVVSGANGTDEISTVSETTVAEIKDDVVTVYTITPEQFGIKRATAEDIMGGDGEANAKITRDILSGADKGPKRDIVLLNAGAALYAGKKASTIEEGMKLAAEAIDSGKAMATLDKLVEYSNK
ncbi:MAG: anthranilate phosphoribosyltransferase [Lachnospiraceae bacterium]|nr:anthranilate phosphoribosyltransferase [Lachnospiraceae bacterium]